MKNTAKILVFIVAIALVFGALSINAFAAKTTADTTFYLTPNANWKKDNARFAVYTWDGGDQWFDMTDSNGDGVYETTIPAGVENIIFCRMTPSATANNWSNKWNQTADLKYDGTNNHYTVTEGTWDKGGGTWSLLELGECIHTPSGEGTVLTPVTCTTDGEVSHTCSKCGDSYTAPLFATGHSYGTNGVCTCGVRASYTVAGDSVEAFGTTWDVANTDNDMVYDAATNLYIKSYDNVSAGDYNFKAAEDHSWNISYGSNENNEWNYWINVPVAHSRLTITFNPATKLVNAVYEAPVAVIGSNYYYDLQSAIDAAVDDDTITLLAACGGDVTVVRALDVDITIDGNNNTFNGTITVNGRSATYATGSLTIKNVKFDATGISKDASINFGGNNTIRYITNVTVENCTFTGADQAKVAIKSYTGGDHNIVVTGCTVDNTMHSIMQVTNVTGLVIDDCEVYSKNGIGINNSSNVEIKNSTVSVSGYAVRAGAGSGGDSGSVTLTNNTLETTATDEGVIVIRGMAQTNIDLVMSENLVSGDIHVQGTTEDTKVSAEANYWDGQKLPTVDGSEFHVTTYYPTEEKTETKLSNLVATLNGVEYDSYEGVFAAAVDGDEVIIVKAGTYALRVSGKNITVTGGVDGVIFEGMGAYNMGQANVTFNNVTFNWANVNYKGLQHSGNLVYNNCTINGQVTLYGVSDIFNECTFNQTSAGAYNVWTYSSEHVEFNKCTFNSAGKSVLVYHEGATTFTELVVTETVFNASSLVEGKAAIEIDTRFTAGAKINVDAATTATGFDAGSVSGDSLWNNKMGNDTDKNNDIVITVGGETVLEPLPYYYAAIGSTKYTSLQAAINAAENGTTITLILDEITLTETLTVNNLTLTLNLNGKTLTFAGATTFSAGSDSTFLALTGNASVTIDGKGTVLTNGAAISVEEGSKLEILNGTFDVDVTEYLAAGLRMVATPQANGSVLYGVVSHQETPFIGTNGNWWVGSYDTGVIAQPKVEIREVDGVNYWFINDVNTGYIADPTDAITPEITIIDGVWHVDLKDGNGFVSTPVTAKPVDGVGISKIEKLEKTDAEKDPSNPNFNVDTYQITYSDGSTSVFYIANGKDGDQGATGNTGLKGQDGVKGNRGEPGANGDSNYWLVEKVVIISLVCVLLSVGVVLVLNHKRLNWWSK